MSDPLVGGNAIQTDPSPNASTVPAACRAPSLLSELVVQQQKRIAALQDALHLATRNLSVTDAGSAAKKTTATQGTPEEMVRLLNGRCGNLHTLWDRHAATAATATLTAKREANDEAEPTHTVERGELGCTSSWSLPTPSSDEVKVHPVIVLDVTSMFSCRRQQPSAHRSAAQSAATKVEDEARREESAETSIALLEAHTQLAQLQEETSRLRQQLQAQSETVNRMKAESGALRQQCTAAVRKLDSVWSEVEVKEQKLAQERAAKDKELERLRVLMRFSELKRDSDLLPDVAREWDAMECETRRLRRDNRRLNKSLEGATRCLEAVVAAAADFTAHARDSETLRALRYIQSLCHDAQDGAGACTPTRPSPVQRGEAGAGSLFPTSDVSSALASALQTPNSDCGVASREGKVHNRVERQAASQMRSGGVAPKRISNTRCSNSTDCLPEDADDDLSLSSLSQDQLSRVRRALMEARRASAATSKALARQASASDLAASRQAGRPPRSASRSSDQRPSSSATPLNAPRFSSQDTLMSTSGGTAVGRKRFSSCAR